MLGFLSLPGSMLSIPIQPSFMLGIPIRTPSPSCVWKPAAAPVKKIKKPVTALDKFRCAVNMLPFVPVHNAKMPQHILDAADVILSALD